jgi:uncharacterized protein involved in tellurium resistance
VHTEDLVVDESSNGETVEAVGETLPQLNIVSLFALVVESVHAVDGSALVVASEEEEVELVLDLVGKKKAYRLYALLATVNVVPEEQVIRRRRISTVLKQPQEIRKLAVNIPANFDRSLELEEIRLDEENLFRSGAELPYLRFK